jgi:hypothetical protein
MRVHYRYLSLHVKPAIHISCTCLTAVCCFTLSLLHGSVQRCTSPEFGRTCQLIMSYFTLLSPLGYLFAPFLSCKHSRSLLISQERFRSDRRQELLASVCTPLPLSYVLHDPSESRLHSPHFPISRPRAGRASFAARMAFWRCCLASTFAWLSSLSSYR